MIGCILSVSVGHYVVGLAIVGGENFKLQYLHIHSCRGNDKRE